MNKKLTIFSLIIVIAGIIVYKVCEGNPEPEKEMFGLDSYE